VVKRVITEPVGLVCWTDRSLVSAPFDVDETDIGGLGTGSGRAGAQGDKKLAHREIDRRLAATLGR
jgi:hypothetical protein